MHKIRKILAFELAPLILANLCLAAIFFCPWTTGNFTFLNQYPILGIVLCAGACFSAIHAQVDKRLASPFVLFGAQLIITILFLRYTGANLIFSDDHPSFLYRLKLLKDHFPEIPFYNPRWNAGYSAREFFPSGILNVFFLTAPFVYFFDFSSVQSALLYNLIIPYLYIFITPWAVFFSLRVFGFGSLAASLAGLFALAPSTYFLEWLLQYGTLGFCLAVGFYPLILALGWKVCFGQMPPSWKEIIALFFISSLGLFWPLGIALYLPLILIALIKFRTVFEKSRRRKILALLFACGAIHSLWVFTFIRESRVFDFLQLKALPGVHGVQSAGNAKAESLAAQTSATNKPKPIISKKIAKSVKSLNESLKKTNPLFIFLLLPALYYLGRDKRVQLIALHLVWVIFLQLLGDTFKPQLELKRMVIPASYLMLVIAAIYLNQSLENKNLLGWNKLTLAALRVIPLGFVFLSVIIPANAYSNRAYFHFKLADDAVQNLAQAIETHGGKGRTFFAGFILHELCSSSFASQDGGHIAPLAAFTSKDLYASDFYHSKWTAVDPIPQSFRDRGPEGIESFLDLIYATAVVSHNSIWAKYFLAQPNYKQVFEAGRFRLFVRTPKTTSYLVIGAGEVKSNDSGISFTPRSISSILRYRFHPRLKPNIAGVRLSPAPGFVEDLGGGKQQEVQFIQVNLDSDSLLGREIKINF